MTALALLSENIWALCTLAIGAFMLIAPGKVVAREQRAHQRRLADRLARGSDAYFEELRTLHAYAPKPRLWAIRLFGLAVLTLGLVQLTHKIH